MKKVLTLLLTITLLLPVFGLSAAAFSDVKSDAWYSDAVEYVVSNNLYQGTSADTFSPNATMTRGMFVTVLGRMANITKDFTAAGTITKADVNMRSMPTTDSDKMATLNGGTTVEVLSISDDWYKVRYDGNTGYIRSDLMSATVEGLTDVPYSMYYAQYIIWAYQCGIATGTTDSTFSPDKAITREDICVYLTKYCSYYGLELPIVKDRGSFSDQDQINDLEAVYALQQAGIIEGRDDGRFDPTASVTRCEVAALFQRYSSADITSNALNPIGQDNYTGYNLFGNITPVTTLGNDSYFDDACFIGHSLVVGMKNYFHLPNADFYAVSGISAKKMLTYDRFQLEETYEDDEGKTVNKLGGVSDILSEKDYGKIYIMLGVNELGPETDHLNMYYNSMQKLVDIVKGAQPDAIIYLISITPIGQERSEGSANFNRENAIKFNDALQNVSLEKNVYYIDAFSAYCDSRGYMPADCATGDGIHILSGKYSVLKELLLSHAL